MGKIGGDISPSKLDGGSASLAFSGAPAMPGIWATLESFLVCREAGGSRVEGTGGGKSLVVAQPSLEGKGIERICLKPLPFVASSVDGGIIWK